MDAGTVYYECDTGAPDWGGPARARLAPGSPAGPEFGWPSMRPGNQALTSCGSFAIESIVFCCCEDILQPGEHNWLAPP